MDFLFFYFVFLVGSLEYYNDLLHMSMHTLAHTPIYFVSEKNT